MQNLPQQYFITASKSETHLINDEKEEYYVIFQKRDNLEISNISNKNDSFGFGNSDKVNTNFSITNSLAVSNIAYLNCISHNISPNLKNAIYTRAP